MARHLTTHLQKTALVSICCGSPLFILGGGEPRHTELSVMSWHKVDRQLSKCPVLTGSVVEKENLKTTKECGVPVRSECRSVYASSLSL
jgi:hypothetical protein